MMWTHAATTSSVLSEDAAAGVRRALELDWQSATPVARVNQFRAYLALSAWTAARMAGQGVIQGAGGEAMTARAAPNPVPSAPADRARIAAALIRTEQLLAARLVVEGDALPQVGDLRTEHEAEETSLAVLAAAAIAVAAVGISAAYAYVAHQAAQVIDRQLARRENTARLVETDARLVELAHNHAKRETDAGKPLPLDEATKEAMRILEARQKELLKAEPELKSGLEKLGGGVPFKWGAGIGIGLVAAALFAVWYLTR